ncbi:EamA family transporter [Lysobacter pythonis]|uniref:EamA family transporter n=1 Tax=Solilutibacter pythonis TaxID=2483112 RepID=A0A3M2I3C2_9GAMM|nr:EamA family transporter [Lysobacter pythonis]RMH94480.1 EamA family transporter [Lysobacter pythonis]
MSTDTTTRPRGGWGEVLLTALAPVIWGTTYIVTTELLPPGKPFTAALLRVLPAGLLLVAWTRCRPGPSALLKLLALGALNITVFQALLFVAAYRLPGGLAAVLGAIQPLIVMALIWAFDSRKPRIFAVLAASMGIVGMVMLLLAPGARWDAIGVLAALAGAVCMAVGTWLIQRWRLPMPVLALTGWQLLLGGLLLLPLVLAGEGWPAAMTPRHLLGYGYLCLFGAVISYALWFRGLTRLSPVAVASLGLLSPLSAVLIGWIWLGEAMRGWSMLGMVTVLASVIAVQRAMRDLRLPATEPQR